MNTNTSSKKSIIESVFNANGAMSMFPDRFSLTVGGKRTEYSFSDVSAFSYSKTSIYRDGFGQGLTTVFRIWNRSTDAAEQFALTTRPSWVASPTFLGLPIRLPFNGTYINPDVDPALEALCEALDKVVSKRMMAELKNNGGVEWVPGVVISRAGLTFTSKSGASTLLGWSQLSEISSYEHKCTVTGVPGSNLTFTCNTYDKNFYPGLRLAQLVYKKVTAA